jgi:hypothetical protein
MVTSDLFEFEKSMSDREKKTAFLLMKFIQDELKFPLEEYQMVLSMSLGSSPYAKPLCEYVAVVMDFVCGSPNNPFLQDMKDYLDIVTPKVKEIVKKALDIEKASGNN